MRVSWGEIRARAFAGHGGGNLLSQFTRACALMPAANREENRFIPRLPHAVAVRSHDSPTTIVLFSRRRCKSDAPRASFTARSEPALQNDYVLSGLFVESYVRTQK